MAQANPSVILVWNGTSYQFVMAGGAAIVVQSTALAAGLVHEGVVTQNLHQAVKLTERFAAHGLQPLAGSGVQSDRVAAVGNSLYGVSGQMAASATVLASQDAFGSGNLEARITYVSCSVPAPIPLPEAKAKTVS